MRHPLSPHTPATSPSSARLCVFKDVTSLSKQVKVISSMLLVFYFYELQRLFKNATFGVIASNQY